MMVMVAADGRMVRTSLINRPRGHARVEHTAPPGFVICQVCGQQIVESHAVRACYQCAYDGKPGFACRTCGLFKQCLNCSNMFCEQHADPKVHVRAGALNVLDTCAKRTGVLERIAAQ